MKTSIKIIILKLFKILALLVSAMAGVFFLALIIYNYIIFKPNLLGIKNKIYNVEYDYKQLLPNIFKIIKHGQGIDQIDRYIANRLLVEMVKERGQLKNWPIEYAVWNYLIKFHLKEDDRLILWCELAPYEMGNGLNNSAKYHYNKLLNELNPKELLKLVIIAKGPRRYKNQPIKINKEIEKAFNDIRFSEKLQ